MIPKLRPVAVELPFALVLIQKAAFVAAKHSPQIDRYRNLVRTGHGFVCFKSERAFRGRMGFNSGKGKAKGVCLIRGNNNAAHVVGNVTCVDGHDTIERLGYPIYSKGLIITYGIYLCSHN